MSLESILNTNNIDKEYEFYWIIFKNNIIYLNSKEINNDVNKLSIILNKMQKNKEYNDIKINISNFLLTHLENMCNISLISNNADNIYKVYNLTNSWIKIENEFLNKYNEYISKLNVNVNMNINVNMNVNMNANMNANMNVKNISSYDLLIVMNNYIKNNYEMYDNTKNYITQIILSIIGGEDYNIYVNKLFIVCIKKNAVSLFDLIRKHVDLKTYIKDILNINDKEINKYINMSSNKLIKLLIKNIINKDI